ncbi:hypothetical protein Tco_1404436 [Tanacetum coccineum]
MKCQPLSFKGTEGVVELTQWIEKMETVFRISNYSVENQIKFSTCTLLGNTLTWWNSHVRTVGNDIAYAMTWTELKKKMLVPQAEVALFKRGTLRRSVDSGLCVSSIFTLCPKNGPYVEYGEFSHMVFSSLVDVLLSYFLPR